MKLLVTGAAGFIGSEVAKLAVERGHSVIGVDNFSPLLYPASIKTARAELLEQEHGVSFFEGDLARDNIENLLLGTDCVINEMAVPGLAPSWLQTGAYFEANVIALSKLLEAMGNVGVDRLVHASTSSVYGDWSENGELNPISPYGVSKLAAEKLIWAYQCEGNFQATVLRYFSVYGPGQRPDMAFAKFIKAAISGQKVSIFGDGKQKRTNTHVRDVAHATLLAAESPKSNFVADISGDEVVTLEDALKAIERATGKVIKIEFLERQRGDQTLSKGDNTSAYERLGWTNKISFEDGIVEQVAAAHRDYS